MSLSLSKYEKILEKIDSARNDLTRDELHSIAKFADDIIVERFIKGGE